MRIDRMLVRLMRLGWRRQLLLAEALAAIAAASLAVRFLPFERAVQLGSCRMGEGPRGDPSEETRWSVEAAAKRVPWRAVCFQRGLALQWMLRRRGIDARLHYGVSRSGIGDLSAHVWIAAGDTIVIGGEEAPNYRAVAVYP